VNERSFLPQRSEPVQSTAALLPPSDQRVADLLAAVRRAFADKGFDGASMQDLAREAGMSVGNFYRYFPSKGAIVDSLIARDFAEMQADFAVILTSDDPLAALRVAIREKVTEPDCGEDGRLWAEITAAALRKPEIGAALQKMEDGIAGNLATVFSRVKGLPFDVALRAYEAPAAFIVLLVKSAMMLPLENPRLREHLTALILRSIDRTLDEIEADPVKAPESCAS
jgi:AcrR family transcriptional regulator